MKKSLTITLIAHHEYFGSGKQVRRSEYESLFSAITDSYIPLLNVFSNLEAEGIPFKINMVISPTLCTLLSDPVIQNQYIEWLDSRILLGEKELKQESNKSFQTQVEFCLDTFKKAKRDFVEIFNQDILSKFDYYAKKGNLELLATTATACFLPHFADLPEFVHAQIDAGLQAHKNFFGTIPEGFWLPHMGYTMGLERFIRPYTLKYTILDSHGVLLGNPSPEEGIFAPAKTMNTLAILGKDNESPLDIIGENGYIHNPVYRNQEKDVGFDASFRRLENILTEDHRRYTTGYRYWAKGVASEEQTIPYDFEKAKEQAKKDALHFITTKTERLQQAAELLKDQDLSLNCVLPCETLGQKWFEGCIWLEEIFRASAQQEELSIIHNTELVKTVTSTQRFAPYYSAATETGYGEIFLDNSNDWTLRYARKAIERMIDLAGRFTDDSGLKARALNLGAKEVLLASSSAWNIMLHEKLDEAYAEECFTESINDFSTVFESLGSNTISTEWLTRVEREHALFPWMNYHIFSPKT